MAKHPTLPVILVFALFFTLIFHDHPPGINLLIFEFVVLGYLYFTGQLDLQSRILKIMLGVQLTTCVATAFVHSGFGYAIHFLVSIVFVGVVIYPSAKSLLNSLLLSTGSFFKSQLEFIQDIKRFRIGKKDPGAILWESRLFAIPSFIIFLFVTIYNFSNPKFNAITADMFSGVMEFLRDLFSGYDFTILFTLFLGLLLANYFLLRTPYSGIISNDINSTDILSNPDDDNFEKLPKIRNEMRSAVFLLGILNVILLVVNVIDINWVWFNFEWEGQYLKQFVHEGTSLLIISILLSIAIVLYYFRGVINFKSNKLLKYLCYAWLFQNAILAVSVALRNLYYIQYFNLAYKRIGVLIFLILTIYGLYSVLVKVHKKYSPFYLFRTNFNALLVVLTISSFVNWDTLIAKYNFNHRDTAFIHLNFLAELSDKSLPHLDKPLSEIEAIISAQKQKYPDEKFYMTPEKYYSIIQERKQTFKSDWEANSWLSWNFPEHLAYNQLFEKRE